MYFPFLACEVECGAAGLDIADLKKCAQHDACSESCHRAFPARQTREGDPSGDPRLLLLARSSFCPNLQSLRRDDGAKTTFYRHPIREFSFWELKGKEKWTAHKFTTNIYHVWMPTHFKKLCSAIDDLPPDLDFDVPPLSHGSGLPQGSRSHHLSQSLLDSASRS